MEPLRIMDPLPDNVLETLLSVSIDDLNESYLRILVNVDPLEI